ncbi:MAG: hypothetical protein ACI4ST_08310, partial [Candidatus Gallimonas sp.]
KGVYFAFSVKDSAIYYSADRTASHNTSVELYLSALGSHEWDGNSFRISVVPTGADSCETEMRTRRVKTADFGGGDALGKTWALWYKAHFAGCHINGMGIDSSFNEGYDIELFVPYESLGLSEKPQAIQFMTAFYHVESAASNADAVWSKCYQSGSIDILGTWLAANNETVLPYAQMADALNVKTDAYMTIDGVLDESVWKTEKALTYRAVNHTYGVDAEISSLAHFGEEGVYLAVTVKDDKIYATNSRNVKYNTGVEIWIQDAEKTEVGDGSVQLRVDALGNISKWYGTENASYLEGYFLSRSAVKLYGATAENGVVATDGAEGFTVEIFLPYSTLGLSEAPDSIAVYPQYIRATDLTNTVNSNSSLWYFVQPASQATAKTDSQNAFLYLGENDFVGEISSSVGGLALGEGERLSPGGYGASVSFVKNYRSTSAHVVSFESVPVVGIESLTQGVTLTEGQEGEYEIRFADAFFGNAGRYEVRLSAGAQEQILPVYLLDSGFAIDGETSAAEGWNENNYLTYRLGTNSYGVDSDSSVSTLVRLGDTGVYVAVKISDHAVFATSAREIKYNSGVEIWIQDANAAAVDARSVQLRIDALGNTETWIGTEEHTFARGSFDVATAVKLLGATAENGVVATNEAEGFLVEIFLPYFVLGLSGAPDSIAVFPQYVHAGDLTNTINSNSTVWSFYNPASQTVAKTDSKNAFLYLYDNDFTSTLSLSSSSCFFGADALTAEGEYKTTVTASKAYAAKASHSKNFLSVPVIGAEFIAESGITVAERKDGEYGITLSAEFVERLRASGKRETVTVSSDLPGGASASISFAMPATSFDGAVTDADDYSSPYYFYAENAHGMEAAVYLKTYDYGVSVALVLDSAYINFGTNETGNNGGGFEIRMANAVDATTGLWWRVFADGTARENINLTQGAPSSLRTTSPAGSSAFAVGLVANDESDLSLGYKQMTLEYFVEYSAIGASGAEDFFLAVGVNDTNGSNGTMGVQWLDGALQKTATDLKAEYWVNASAAENYKLNIASATAIFGNGTIRVATSLSSHTYPKGVEFTTYRENITEGARGNYALAGLTEGGAVPFTALEKNGSGTVAFTVTNEMPDTTFDGAVTEADVYGVPYSFYTKTTHEMEVTVYIRTYDYGVSVALVMDSAYINFGTNETGNNGGGFEIRMANAVDATTGIWWRVFADGTARENTNLTQGAPLTARTTSPAGSSAFAVGLVANDESDLSLGYKQMTVEYFVEYSAIDATGAEDFFLAVGANDTNSSNGTMAVCWMDRSTVTVPAEENWVTAGAVEGLQMSVSDVSAVEGNATFKAGTTLSQYAYLKGVTFAGAEVSEGGYGRYTVSVTEGTTSVTATLGALSDEFVIVNRTVSLDGAIGENEYAGYFTLSATGVGKDAN